MAPANALQDRIRQFESLDGGIRPMQSKADRPRPSYPPLPRGQASFGNSVVSRPPSGPLEDPISPTVASYTIIKPAVPYVARKPRIKSPSPSPPNLGLNTSLIDLKEWMVEDGPNNRNRNNGSGVSKSVSAPPLPPRISSQNSGASGSTTLSSWSSQKAPSIQSRSSSNSLTVDHSYPPFTRGSSNSNSRQRQGHVPASSTSSFHSVSLSSDGDATTDCASTDAGSSVSSFIATYPVDKPGDNDIDRERDSVEDSLSFETVSSTNLSSPTLSLTHEWEKDFSTQSLKNEPPKLPSRRTPLGKPPSSPMQSPYSSPPQPSSLRGSPTLKGVRRVPPPPPTRFSKPPASTSSRASLMSTTTSTSDRSSIFSTGTVTTPHTSIGSCTQLLRPTPVPLVARKRYEAVFFANVNAQRRATLKALSPSGATSPANSSPASPSTPRRGWRGVSVDLVTNPEENPVFATLGDDVEGSRLDGQVVKTIWSQSKLLTEKLRDIWNECAFPGQTSLDKDGFVKGMWRIDEELRRVQSMRSSTMTMTNKSQPLRRTTTESLLH